MCLQVRRIYSGAENVPHQMDLQLNVMISFCIFVLDHRPTAWNDLAV